MLGFELAQGLLFKVDVGDPTNRTKTNSGRLPMSQVNIPVQVHYDSTSNGILFGSESPYVTSVMDGHRAEIRVPYRPGVGARTITLHLSGDGATFPEEEAVVWTKPAQQPEWAQVDRSLDTQVLITVTWQPGDEHKDAAFILRVRAGGSIYKSEDPTIINNPDS